MRLAILTLVAVAAMAVSVLYASNVQRSTEQEHGEEAALAQRLLADANRFESSVGAYALSGDREALRDAEEAYRAAALSLGSAEEMAREDRVEAGRVAEHRAIVAELRASLDAALSRPTPVQRRAALRDSALERHELLDELSVANAALRSRAETRNAGEAQRASLVAPILIVVLGGLFTCAALLTLARNRRAARELARIRSGQERFGEAMQVSDTQREAHGLLKSHLERTIPGTSITVLNRNNSADRLEASTDVADDSPLGEALQHARPRSCMAIRLTRPFAIGAGSDEVLRCEVCGVLSAASTCLPLLVGGEVIGSVLAEHAGQLAAGDRDRIEQSVAQAAPMLANLRNLAIAETRAATDTLTGLPNRRAVDDSLLRMIAQAGRSFSPLSVILLDLDHFKDINDAYGHDRGDEVLAAVAAVLRESVRDSDFAGRSGGEEFVIFLPETDRTGAVRLGEKLRARLRALTVTGVDRDITASFGIACFPDDAVEAPALMRSADRALYAAKRGGRDRIESSSSGAPVTTADADTTVGV